MSVLVVAFVTAACVAVGAGLLAAAGALPWPPAAAGRSARAAAAFEAAALAFVAGLVACFLLLLAFDLAGVPWRRRTLVPGLAALAAANLAAGRYRRRRGALTVPVAGAPPGWGDGAAGVAVAAVAWGCWSRLAAIPDFVYHWGAKGKRYQQAGGIDYAFLADPLRLTDHPDYPNLLPSLYAATAHLRGFFDERAMLLFSPLFVAAAVLAARGALVRGTASPPYRQGGTAAVALAAAMFAIGYRMAGGGDLVVSLALLSALPALLPAAQDAAVEGRGARDAAAATRADDLRLGWAAALAAAVKIEGVPLAALLIGVRWWLGGAGRRFAVRRLPRLALPAAAVVVPWAAANLVHGLFQENNTGSWDGERLAVVARAALEVFATREWHGLPWLLAALPAVLLVRRLRPAAALLLAQAGFYLAVYLTSPVDTEFYVLSSLPRLLYHLLLPALVLYALALAPRQSGRK